MGFYHNNMSRLHKYSSRLVYGDTGGDIASICLNLSRSGQLIIRQWRWSGLVTWQRLHQWYLYGRGLLCLQRVEVGAECWRLQIIRNPGSRSRHGTIKLSSVEPRRIKYLLDVVVLHREHLVVFVADDSLLMESGGECPGNHWVAPIPAIKVSSVRLKLMKFSASPPQWRRVSDDCLRLRNN